MLRRIRIRNTAASGNEFPHFPAPCDIQIEDMDTGELIDNVTAITFNADVNNPIVSMTLTIVPAEIDMLDMVAEELPAIPVPTLAHRSHTEGETSYTVPIYSFGDMDPKKVLRISKPSPKPNTNIEAPPFLRVVTESYTPTKEE